MKSSLLLLFSSFVLLQSSVAAASPNILFILADDMGFGDLGANNPNSKIATPNLDQLAAGGMRFTDAHAGGSSCVPSRYALLTGRFAVRAKMDVSSGPVIEEGRQTVASLLRDSDYSTAMVGKWHLGFEMPPNGAKNEFDYSKPLRGGPMDRGFDSFFGMHASLDIPPYFFIRGRAPLMPPTGTIEASASEGTNEGWNNIQGAFWRAGPVSPDFKHTEVTPRFAKEAVEVIRHHAAGKKEKPLFLYLALPSPHTPWLPLDEFRGKSGAGMYGDFVMQVDAAVGQVLDSLDAAGLTKDTLVFFSSDNGPVWYDKDREKFGHDSVGGLSGMKFSSYEGGHRMPFIARWPGRIAPGSVCEQTIAFADVFATLAELVGLKQIPQGMAEDSVSFLSWLLNSAKPAAPRAPIVHDEWTLREGDWKLILPRKKRERGSKDAKPASAELFNLREDLAEQHNLFSEQPERAQKMQEKLKALLAFMLAEAVPAAPAGGGPVVCEETEAAIRITLRGNPVLTYQKTTVSPPEGIEALYSRSGYIHPVYSPSGKQVTGDFPVDHPHQHALFFAWTSTTFEGRKVDFWNQRLETGRVAHAGVLSVFNEPDSAGFSVKLVHSDRSAPGGEKPVLNEIWTVRVHATPPGDPYLIDIQSVQTCATDSPLTLNEYHYGAMAIRGNAQWFDPEYADAIQAWEQARKKNSDAPSPKIAPPGDFLTSEGKTRLDGNHTRPHWVDMFGKTDGEHVGVAILSHPSNFQFPQPVRLHPSKPYFCFSPTVLGEFQIVPGKEYTSRYRCLVHDGKPDQRQLDKAWADYAKK